MRFAFSDDQLAFRDAVRDLLTQQCPPAVVRAAWPEPEGAPGATGAGSAAALDRVWASLADMGVLGVAVPEVSGGLGLTELDWVSLAEEAGYAALPLPLVETAAVVGPLVAAHGDPGGHLAGLIEGSIMATARLVGDGPMPFGQTADLALLPVDGALVLTDLRSAQLRPLASVDGSRALAEVSAGTDAGASVMTADPAEIELAVQRGALGAAASLLGLGRRMLDLTVGYVQERRQFGVPIGSFQAVKHHLADARLQLEFAAPAVYRAAWSLATGAPTAARDVSMAKAMASDAAELTGRQALQCHGAIGYTVEYDLHLYLKRTWALSRDWGDAASHRALVADVLEID